MKVLGISSSHRKDSNSAWFLDRTLELLAREGLETEFVSLRGKSILPCEGCYGCATAKECVQQGDDFAPIFSQMVAADGILVASPVYYASAAPQLMCLLERAGFAGRMSGKYFSGKVGAPITVARRTGHTFAFAQLLLWYFINDMVIPGSIYWNVGMAGARGAFDADRDTEGLQILEHFAKNMARVMKALRA